MLYITSEGHSNPTKKFEKCRVLCSLINSIINFKVSGLVWKLKHSALVHFVEKLLSLKSEVKTLRKTILHNLKKWRMPKKFRILTLESCSASQETSANQFSTKSVQVKNLSFHARPVTLKSYEGAENSRFFIFFDWNVIIRMPLGSYGYVYHDSRISVHPNV